MRRILTIFVSLHWAAVFGTLSVLSIMGSGQNAPKPVLRAMGFSIHGSMGSNPAVTALLAIGLACLSAIFVWVMLTAFNRNEEAAGLDEAARMAIGASIGFLTVVMMMSLASGPGDGAMLPISIQLAALLISYLAIFAERAPANTPSADHQSDNSETAVRRMALEARSLALRDTPTARLYTFPAKDR